MAPKITAIITSLFLFSLLMAVGCGQPKVNGRVVFSDDQSPVTYGVVFFHGDHGIARGFIQPDGKFTVESLGGNDGLPAGQQELRGLAGVARDAVGAGHLDDELRRRPDPVEEQLVLLVPGQVELGGR